MQLLAFFLGCSLSNDTSGPLPHDDRPPQNDSAETGDSGDVDTDGGGDSADPADTGGSDSGGDTGTADSGGDSGPGDTGGSDSGASDTADTGGSDSGGDTGTADTGGSDTAATDTAADTGADTGATDTAADTGGTDTGADTASDTAPADTAGDTSTEDTAAVDPAEACHPDIVGWPQAWIDLEDDVLDLVNAHRATGYDCGAKGWYPPVAPLTMDPAARCAARYHAKWMHDNGSFSHSSPGGDLGDAWNARMVNAGYDGDPYAENIASGFRYASSVVSAWMGSDGHCANIMASYPDDTGIGFYEGTLNRYRYWTHNFGK